MLYLAAWIVLGMIGVGIVLLTAYLAREDVSSGQLIILMASVAAGPFAVVGAIAVFTETLLSTYGLRGIVIRWPERP